MARRLVASRPSPLTSATPSDEAEGALPSFRTSNCNPPLSPGRRCTLQRAGDYDPATPIPAGRSADLDGCSDIVRDFDSRDRHALGAPITGHHVDDVWSVLLDGHVDH